MPFDTPEMEAIFSTILLTDRYIVNNPLVVTRLIQEILDGNLHALRLAEQTRSNENPAAILESAPFREELSLAIK